MVDSGLAEWLDNSFQSTFDTIEHQGDKNAEENEDIKHIMVGEETNWDIPNGLPEDVLNMKELYAATKEGCEEFLDDNLGKATFKHHQQHITQKVSSSPIIPVKLSSTSTLPADMPSLAVVKGLTSCESAVPHVLWSQDHQAVLLRVSITSVRDITPGQVFVGVKEQELVVQALKVDISESGELYTLYQTPPLRLYGKVDPVRTKVVVLARGITITLAKQRNMFWMQLSRQRYGWIKKDANVLEVNPEEEEMEGANVYLDSQCDDNNIWVPMLTEK